MTTSVSGKYFSTALLQEITSCIKLISSKFKSKKIMQTLLSSIVFLGIFYLSMNLESFISDIASKATSINDLLTKIYYPLGLYINLITKFKILELLKLLLVNIIPFMLFIFFYLLL